MSRYEDRLLTRRQYKLVQRANAAELAWWDYPVREVWVVEDERHRPNAAFFLESEANKLLATAPQNNHLRYKVRYLPSLHDVEAAFWKAKKASESI